MFTILYYIFVLYHVLKHQLKMRYVSGNVPDFQEYSNYGKQHWKFDLYSSYASEYYNEENRKQ